MSFLGFILGSFFAHIIYSRKFNKSAFKKRSECDNCGVQLSWYDNIPIISYLLLKGKCRNCQNNIPRGYLFIELTVFIIFTTFAIFNLQEIINYQLQIITLILTAVILGSLVYNSIYDIYFFEIDDKVVIATIVILLITRILTLQTLFYYDIYLQAGILGVIIFGLTVVLSRGKMGSGEIIFGFLMGLILGLKSFYIAFMLSIVFAIIGGTVIYTYKKVKLSEEIKFGKVMVPLVPFLSFGTIVSYFWGEKVFKIIFKI